MFPSRKQSCKKTKQNKAAKRKEPPSKWLMKVVKATPQTIQIIEIA